MVTSYDKLKQDVLDVSTLLPYDQVIDALREMSVIIDPTAIDSNAPTTDYSKPWPDWFKVKGVNTVLTQEFVEELYREMRMRRLADKPMVEICAGRGKLSYQLRKRGIDIVATDNYSQGMERDEGLVERLNHAEALQKYQPRIVVASWIPRNPEIGDDVLNFPTVDYFIDIGETRGGSTWLRDNYRNEDFTTKYLSNVTRYAIGTNDYFGLTQTGRVEFVNHTQVRLWKRKGAPMSIDHSIQ